MPGENMAKITIRTLLVAFLSLAASAALSQNSQGQNSQGQNYQGGRAVSAPEIDPGQALGALALLGGTFAIIRGYRRSKN